MLHFEKEIRFVLYKEWKKAWNNNRIWIVPFGAYVRLKQYLKGLRIVQSIWKQTNLHIATVFYHIVW